MQRAHTQTSTAKHLKYKRIIEFGKKREILSMHAKLNSGFQPNLPRDLFGRLRCPLIQTYVMINESIHCSPISNKKSINELELISNN